MSESIAIYRATGLAMPLIITYFRFSSGLVIFLVILLLLISATKSYAEDMLPSPLHLHQALQIAVHNNPAIIIAQTMVELAQAKAQQADAENATDIFLELNATRVKQSTTDTVLDDGHAHIGARQRLFDFGVSSSTRAQHQHNVAAQKWFQKISRTKHLLATEKAYYDVLLSDLRYSADNEAMVAAFLVYSKTRDRHSLGILSDLELAKSEYQYGVLLNKRKNSEILQRTTRQKLAILLNRPNDVPAELIMPELMFLDKKAPDAIEYYQRSLAVNPQILLMRETVKAKRSAVLAKKNSALPVISALLEVNEYERELDSRNKVEIGLQLTLPIYQSGLHTAKKAQAIADLQLSAAQLTLAEQRLQQDILELALYLDELSIRKQSVAQQLDYRELEMDKHRVEYELEIQTNMSSAGARMSLAQWQAAEIDFQIELAWKKLNALMGQAPDTAPKELQQ